LAELPEITRLAGQMSKELSGKEVQDVHVRQEKCLNMDKEEFGRGIKGKKVVNAFNKGKWIFVELSGGKVLLLNLGMGGDILYYLPQSQWNEEYQCRFRFSDQSGFTCKFWWFGYIRLLDQEQLASDKDTKDIALSPIDDGFSREYFRRVLINNRSQVKKLILDQKKISGIGNMYIHDILFLAGVHPSKTVNTLSNEQIDRLYDAIVATIGKACKSNGCAYEKDFYGNTGGVATDWFLIGYREGHSCPNCGNKVEKIKTGSTSSFVCPCCQPL